MANEAEPVPHDVRQLHALPLVDGVTFAAESLRAAVIRDVELYSGFRIVVPASIDRARHRATRRPVSWGQIWQPCGQVDTASGHAHVVARN